MARHGGHSSAMGTDKNKRSRRALVNANNLGWHVVVLSFCSPSTEEVLLLTAVPCGYVYLAYIQRKDGSSIRLLAIAVFAVTREGTARGIPAIICLYFYSYTPAISPHYGAKRRMLTLCADLCVRCTRIECILCRACLCEPQVCGWLYSSRLLMVVSGAFVVCRASSCHAGEKLAALSRTRVLS